MSVNNRGYIASAPSLMSCDTVNTIHLILVSVFSPECHGFGFQTRHVMSGCCVVALIVYRDLAPI